MTKVKVKKYHDFWERNRKSEGYLLNVGDVITISQLLSNFENNFALVFNEDGEAVDDGIACTGYFVKLIVNGEEKDSVQIVIKGDVNGDGKVDTTDYLRVKGKFLGRYSVEGAYAIAADLNDDGAIDTTDYLKIKSAFLGIKN
jgi:hypothetical protein